MQIENIVLIGFMGSGKSHFARVLSQRHSLKMVDIDLEIEAFCQKSIQKIFGCLGESYFRKIESRLFSQLVRGKKGFVIAAGGGLPLNIANQKTLSRQTVVYLNFPFSIIWQQLKKSRSRRPLLKNLDKGMVQLLWQQRRSGYHKASDYVIKSEEKLLQLFEWLNKKGKNSPDETR